MFWGTNAAKPNQIKEHVYALLRSITHKLVSNCAELAGIDWCKLTDYVH